MKPLLAFFFNLLALIAPFGGFSMGMAATTLASTNWGHIAVVFVFIVLGVLFSISMLMMKEILKGDF